MNRIKLYLDEASKAYYNGEPFLSDEAFDRLAESIGYNAVGAKQHGHIEKHYFRMYSLQKHYEGETKNPIADKKKVRSLKLDGAAISVLYIKGELARVMTRGDGIEGTVITDKFQDGVIIPTSIGRNGPDILQITGEIVAPKNIENSRNYAAGALNLKSVGEFKERTLAFFAYSVQTIPDQIGYFSTYLEDMQFLESLGFQTILNTKLDTIYPCDGFVDRVNSNKEFLEMGFTSKHPKGAVAIKERGEAIETKLLRVEWNVGRSGKVTPVAILEPVLVGDALVSRATLNNPGFIEALDLRVGDTVAIERAGEIIPRILYKVDA